MKKLLTLLTISLLLFSCSKEKSKKWIVFDLNVVNADNGEPVVADFRLDYTTKGVLFGGEAISQDIGTSNSYGVFQREVKIPRDAGNFILSYNSSESSWPEFWISASQEKTYKTIEYSITSDGLNKFSLIIDPIYKFYLHLSNVNCFNETDTLWSTNSNFELAENADIFTGCVDTLLGGPAVSFEPEILMYFTLKRNGVVTHITKDFNFESEYATIELDY